MKQRPERSGIKSKSQLDASVIGILMIGVAGVAGLIRLYHKQYLVVFYG